MTWRRGWSRIPWEGVGPRERRILFILLWLGYGYAIAILLCLNISLTFFYIIHIFNDIIYCVWKSSLLVDEASYILLYIVHASSNY